MRDPYQASRDAFDRYAGMDAPEVPDNPLSALQVRLCRWQTRNFGAGTSAHSVLGVVEEVGEALEGFLGLAVAAGRLAHAVLKADQKIRSLSDPEKARRAVADGVADLSVYAIQVCTAFRLDYGVLLTQTAEDVMQRDWKSNPETGGAK